MISSSDINKISIIDKFDQKDKNIKIKLSDFGSSQITNNNLVNSQNNQFIANNQDY